MLWDIRFPVHPSIPVTSCLKASRSVQEMILHRPAVRPPFIAVWQSWPPSSRQPKTSSSPQRPPPSDRLSGWSSSSDATWAEGCGWCQMWWSSRPRRRALWPSSCSALCTVHVRRLPGSRSHAWSPEWCCTTSPWRQPSACVVAPHPEGRRRTVQSGRRRHQRPGARRGTAGFVLFFLGNRERFQGLKGNFFKIRRIRKDWFDGRVPACSFLRVSYVKNVIPAYGMTPRMVGVKPL